MNIHSSFILSRSKLEILNFLPKSKWINKSLYIHIMVCYSATKRIKTTNTQKNFMNKKSEAENSIYLFRAGLSLSVTNAVVGSALVIFIMVARCPLAKTIRKL